MGINSIQVTRIVIHVFINEVILMKRNWHGEALGKMKGKCTL